MEKYMPRRYDYTTDYGMDLSPNGEYVEYFEYNDLQKQLDELKAFTEKLKRENVDLESMVNAWEREESKIKANTLNEIAEGELTEMAFNANQNGYYDSAQTIDEVIERIKEYANQLEGKE